MEESKEKNLLKKAETFIKYQKVAFKSIAMGIVAGMRSMLAPAVASHYLKKRPSAALALSDFRFMKAPETATITKALSAVEIAGDKVPGVPNRISIVQLLARVASGGIVGGALFRANNRKALNGILIGGASALAATFGSFYFRKFLDKLPYLNDFITGGIEDIIALNSGILVMKNE